MESRTPGRCFMIGMAVVSAVSATLALTTARTPNALIAGLTERSAVSGKHPCS